MINNRMFCIILMVGTVDTPPLLLMSKGEERKYFSHDHVVGGQAVLQGMPAVLSVL